jgi:hypothetical protein
MMVKVLLYAYTQGIYASRRIARRLHEDVAFRVLAAGNTPDFRTISDFRKRHLEALRALFPQVLALAQRAGLVKLGQVALDGTKLRANASKHKAMSYGRMCQEEARLATEVDAMLRQAEEADAADDARYGPEHSGDELPEGLRRREERLRRIREAKAALEAEARQRAAAAQAQREAGGPRRRPPAAPSATPRPQDQYNFTDPDSRIMKMADGSFAQAYNAQVVVDAARQIIVATDVTAVAADAPHLPRMVDATQQQVGPPERLTADAGYYSEENCRRLQAAGIDALIPPDKLKHTDRLPRAPRGRIPKRLSMRERMRRKLQTQVGWAVYRMHKAIAEPVLGQIKGARGFQRFLLRGLPQVRAEWTLVATVHNICKLFQAGPQVRRVWAAG